MTEEKNPTKQWEGPPPLMVIQTEKGGAFLGELTFSDDIKVVLNDACSLTVAQQQNHNKSAEVTNIIQLQPPLRVIRKHAPMQINQRHILSMVEVPKGDPLEHNYRNQQEKWKQPFPTEPTPTLEQVDPSMLYNTGEQMPPEAVAALKAAKGG